MYCNVPATVPIGQNLLTNAEIVPLVNEIDLVNNYDTCDIDVVGSYDPNIKVVEPEGIGAPGYITTDDETLEATRALSRLEGILPALESAHAIAYGMKLASQMRPDQTVLVNLSGRGDKDVQTLAAIEGLEL